MKTPLKVKGKKQPTAAKAKQQLILEKDKKDSANQNNVREPLEVFGRIRPMKNENDKICVTKVSDNILKIDSMFPPYNSHLFKFNNIFDSNIAQQNVFNEVAVPLVNDLINAKNGLIFTYGVSGSGKTYTITGSPQDCGLLPRVLDMVFNTLEKHDHRSFPYIFKPDFQNGFDILPAPDAVEKIQENLLTSHDKIKQKIKPSEIAEWENRKKEEAFVKDIDCDFTYSVFVSYVEIYNNYVYDLLDDQQLDLINSNGTRTMKPKAIKDDNKKRCFVQGVKEMEVLNANEACELFIKGMNRRKTGNTLMNKDSSRSHSIFTIRVVQAPLELEGVLPIENKKFIRIGQLSIVDLAGCERTGRTKATGDRLKEAGNINNSLLILRKCFDILRENQKGSAKNTMVPYRESKLTHLFKSYFEGDGRVRMVICLNPGMEDYDETIQVCKFAETSQEITTFQTNVMRFPPRKFNIPATNNVDYGLSMVAITIPFPDQFLIEPDNEEIIPRWIECLEKRQQDSKEFDRINRNNQMVIRNRITEMENELGKLRQKLPSLEMDLECRDMQLREYENKFSQINQQIFRLEDDLSQSKLSNKKLTAENSRLKHEINTLKEEYKRFKNNIFESLLTERQKRHEELWKFIGQKSKEKKLKERLEFMGKYVFNDSLFPETLKKFMNNENEDTNASNSCNSNGCHSNKSIVTFKSKTPEYKRSQNGKNEVYADPGAPKQLPVINPKYRRSLTPGKVKFIDHRPMENFKLGTFFQPKPDKSKSVTKLKASDFLKPDVSKYLLTHHEATDSGKIETKVFKGNIIPTSVGGAQIIFDDIECLKQVSPKRLFTNKN